MDGSLARKKDAGTIVASDVLVLLCVDIQHVVLALKGLVVGQEDEFLCFRVEFTSGLLNGGERRVKLGQGLVTKVVRLLDVGIDVLVWLGKVGQDGGGEGLVGGVCEGDGFLTDGVGLEGLDAVVDNRPACEVLWELSALLWIGWKAATDRHDVPRRTCAVAQRIAHRTR